MDYKTITQPVAGLALAGASMLPNTADAASVTVSQIDPDTFQYSILNDDGVNYDSLSIDTNPVFDQLSALTGKSIDDLTGESTVNVSSFGDVDGSWNAAYDSLTGVINITHAPGDAGLDYEAFAPGLDQVILASISANGYDLNLENNPVNYNSELVEASTGSSVNSAKFYAAGPDVNVVPSPTALMMVAPFAAGYLMRRPKRD